MITLSNRNWSPADPRPSAGRFPRGLAIADLLVMVVAMATAQALRFGGDGIGVSLGIVDTSYTVVSLILAAVWLLSLAAFGGYETWPRKLNGPSYAPPIRATFLLFGLLAIASLLAQLELSRGYLAGALPLGLVGLMTTRYVCRRWIDARRKSGRFVRRALIVGPVERTTELAAALTRGRDGIPVEIVATTEESANHRIAELVGEYGIDLIVLTEEHDGAGVRQLLWDMEGAGVVVWVSVDVPELAAPRATFHPIDHLPVVEVAPADRSAARQRLKRAFDLVLSALALAVAAPVIAICAGIVRADSPGSAFFTQVRIGRDGKPFRIVKLRTMRVNAEAELEDLAHRNEAGGPLFKIQDDPRITRVGRFLRRTSLDELPQLWNVLVGDMSLVGPRPPLPSEVEQYDPASRRRLIVKPGLTGLWQVSGRSDLTWEQGVRLDLFYVENWSITGDIHILIQTVGTVLRPNGAY
jgi:exopolysaccharide biosynthesis polyprenyl glycosylphosphotransferase